MRKARVQPVRRANLGVRQKRLLLDNGRASLHCSIGKKARTEADAETRPSRGNPYFPSVALISKSSRGASNGGGAFSMITTSLEGSVGSIEPSTTVPCGMSTQLP